VHPALRSIFVAVAAAFTLLCAPAWAQAPPSTPPCQSAPAYRQFDFWIGEWDVHNAQGRPVGESSIQLILGGCVILENWTGRDGFTGKSFNSYNRNTKKWEQVWVDVSGAFRKFAGEFKDGELHYVAHDFDRAGRPILIRMIFQKQGDDRVRQRSEFSADAGATWQPRYDFVYTRRAAARNSSLSLQDVEAIRGVLQSYARAWLDGNPEAVMGNFTDDAVLLPHHGGTPHVGAAAIRQFWWPPNSPPVRVTELQVLPDEISGEGTLAFARGRFSLAFTLEQNGQAQSFANAGTFLMVLHKNPAGEWQIARYMWDDPPAQPR
jgi:ketosteroid isomerase-like protein